MQFHEYGEPESGIDSTESTLPTLARSEDEDIRYQMLEEQLPLFSPATAQVQEQLPRTWNYPREGMLAQIFEAQVQAHPEAIAVIDEQDREISYGELNQRANALATFLQERGIGAEETVGLLAERSLALLVGFLGVVKTGAAYVPLDPSHPDERLGFMLTNARASLLLTQQPERQLQWSGRSLALLPLVEPPSSPMPDPLRRTGPLNLACVLYTSGSTGQAKGIGITQRGILRLVLQTNYVHISPQATVLHLSNISFDVTTYEVWGALLNGARLRIVPQSVLLDPAAFSHLVREQQEVIAFLTTALFNYLAPIIPETFRHIAHLSVGGEALDPVISYRIQQEYAPGQLICMYGPAENTTASTTYDLRGLEPEATTVPIGSPIANSDAYVLDAEMRLEPPGLLGELYVGGDGLARGYLHRPELTAQAFVPHPFSRQPGARLYKTGDLARYRSDGVIEFAGRVDDQVKIRGFRIEPGEIEVVLKREAVVRDAFVLARTIQGSKQLVAYVVPQQEQSCTAELLREALHQHLPPYMVPAFFVFMASFPLTPHGKVDRRALPEPEEAAGSLEDDEDWTPVQRQLAALWREVLHLNQVGLHDDFFALGGQSLLGIQLMSRIIDVFHCEAPIQLLFASPTIDGLAQAITVRLADPTSLPAVRVVKVTKRPSSLPLSFAQEQLWFQEQLHPGSSTYTIPCILSLRGPLDVVMLTRCWQILHTRHEALRTVFEKIDGRPVQRIQPPSDVVIPFLDLSHMEAEARQVAREEAIQQTISWHFDLQGSLVHLRLVRLQSEEHLLCCAFHHGIFDGWSLQIVLRELAHCYQRLLAGDEPELPELSLQPVDHALWQRTPAYGERVQSQLEYWQRLLSGAPEAITLATDLPRPAQQSFQGARYYYVLPQPLLARLREQSQQETVTLSMALFTLFTLLLAHYSRQDDLVIGTALAGRSELELEPLVGFFVNMLPLRVRLDDRPSFHTLLRRVQALFLDGFTHQDVPFEQIVEAVQPRRSLSFHPLFQVSFAFQPYQIPSHLGHLDMQQLAVPMTTSQFDLTLFIDEYADGSLHGSWEYNTDLFKAPTIKMMHERFLQLIESALEHPEQPFSRLNLLSDVEQQQMLGAWNETRTAYPREETLAQIFEAQVQAHPETIAVIDEQGREISYGELNQRANALATFLQERRIGLEETVGLLAERSLALLVGFLGVVKAGAAYVPLDPSYPDERLQFMLTNARASLLLTQQPERQLQWSGRSFALLPLVELPSSPMPDPQRHIGPLNLACVLYTSGSTGQAKGIGITQQGILRLVLQTNYVHISPQATVLHLSNTSFDATTYEVWGALLNGARLCIVPQSVLLSPDLLAQLVQRQREVVVLFTTALFNYLAHAVPEMFRSIAHLSVGGEALDPVSSYRIQQEYAPGQFLCLYGPAESTTVSTFYDLSGLEPEATTVAIGAPIANSEAYVLDAELQLVPPGLLGELYVGGDGLVRGYLGRPELTAQTFVPHPFSRQPGARLYKTGDLARYRFDGVIEFAGRVDDQVKIRGFRIEPGEIEVALKREAGVRDAFVLVRTIQGSKQLVAYVVPQQEQSCTAEQLREALHQHLPPYMVPAFFVFMAALPLNSNGKVDRQALPEPETASSPHQELEEESWHPVERELAALWKEVLHLNQVGLHDNFFALGGQSLLGIQLMSRIANVFHCEAPIRLLFASPTIAELAQAIMPRLADTTRLAVSTTSKDEQRPELLPLSFAQEQLWFQEQLHPGESTYTTPCILSLRGPLDVVMLTRCWQFLLARHEALRTIFTEVDGRPVQRIQPPSDVVIPFLDLSHMEAEARQVAREEAIQQTISWHFDLQGSLVHLRLVRLQSEEHLLCCAFHHGIFDGWSLQIVLRELAHCYQRLLAGDEPELPELPLQPVDHALWQRTPAYGERVQSQLEYWQRLLSGAPEAITLATDFPRPPQQLAHGDSYYCSFPPPLVARLREQSQQASTTLPMTLFTLFALLLAHYSRQDDLVIGTALAGRSALELEPLVGLFASVLPLRVRLDDRPSFQTLLQRVHALFLDGFTHQDVPFEQIVEAVQPRRSLSFHPLFQVSFAFQPYQIPSHLGPLDMQQLPTRTTTSQFDITFFIDEHADGSLHGSWEYNTGLFKVSTIKMMHERFLQLIESALEHPERPFSRLNLLSDVEQQQMLGAWNETRTAYPREGTLAQIFEAQVQAHPETIAVIDEQGREVSYGELNQRANALAAFLQERGIGPEETVGLLAERSLALLVGLLGVVKAGAAYVPLDPSYPDERLQFMLSNARIVLLLSRDPQRHLHWDGPSFSLDAFMVPSTVPVSNPIQRSAPLNLACIHYTSGSTGQAKGIGVTQQSILRLVLQTNFVHITPQATLLHLSNTSFDATTYEVWGALLNGARVCIVPQQVVLDPTAFSDLVQRQQEVITFLTTALFNYLARTVPEMFRYIAHLTVGGEALDPALTYMIQQGYAPRQFLAMYGPTENTTASTIYDLRELEPEATTVAIGAPIANSEAYVLDAELQLVPPGLLGELYVGGDGLARGYLGRPELTAQTFVPHPFSRQPGARLYKTGDLARYRFDGVIEFAGRVDDQVKIRGFRIEPGEIEVALKREAGVRDAFVLARMIQGSKQLVAYVVPQQEQSCTAEQLREALHQHLPLYMVPAFFVFMAALPLNSNGKVDRQALPAPEETIHASMEEEDWTLMQRQLAALWREVLHLNQVGLHDDFFSVGGHSLLVTQLTSRIHQQWHIHLPLRLLFEEPTIEGLARRIVSLQEQQAVEPYSYQDAAIPIQQREDENLVDLPGFQVYTFPLSFAQQRLWLLDQLEPGNSSYNIVSSIAFHGPLQIEILHESLRSIVARHEDLRTTFRVVRDEPVQVIVPTQDVPLPLIDLRPLPTSEREATIQRLANEEMKYAFQLSRGPLIRCTLLCASEQDYVLLLNVHHIVFDGWSLNNFLNELAQLYTACIEGREPDLAPLPLQYADYAVWQRKWLEGPAGREQVAYWKRSLADTPTLLDLPTDRVRPPIQSYRGGMLHAHLPAELSRQLRAYSQQEGVTLFMTLLALFQIVLARYAGQDKLLVGTPIANRNRADIESLIGFFVNTLVIRADLSQQPTFREYLHQVRETLLGAYTHQDVSFDHLLEELNPPRSLSHPPLFQVLFNMVNLPAQESRWPGLEVTTSWPQEVGSKFDLTLFVDDAGDTIQLDLIYNMDLFDRARMEDLLRQYELLARQAMQRDENVFAYSLVTDYARTLLPNPLAPLSENWEGPIYDLISRQARLHPSHLALVDDEQQITYQQLERYSDRVGRYLRCQHICQGAVVTLTGTRGVALVCTLLGILKAGATVLLLDPAYPVERRSLYARLAHVRYAFSIAAQDEADDAQMALPEAVPHRCLSPRLDQDWLGSDEELTWRPVDSIQPDDIAFITFTSGSTGRPKGVLQRHGPLSHFIPWQRQRFALGNDDHHSMLSGVAHDPLQREIFTALATGGTLYIASPEQVAEPGWLASWMRQHRISITSLTPATLQFLTQIDDMAPGEDSSYPLSTLRYAFFVGDVLTRKHVSQVRAFAPQAAVVNFYGSTETQRSLGYFVMPPAHADQPDLLTTLGKEIIPLGKGIPDVQLLLLNTARQLAGIGELGEVVFRSPHLAAGYLEQPELTAQRFQHDIVASTTCGSCYRSGDLGRYLPDGNVEFAGRRDEQIKLRGFRIEPGEIEAAILQLPDVAEAKVLLRENTPGEKSLVAYIGTGISTQDASLSIQALRTFLLQQLPLYMVPSTFVLLARLPRTPNAKLDLRALPAPEQATHPAGQGPQSKLEAQLAPLWSEILQVRQPDRDANFFELGGHSILATRLLARVQRTFQVTITLRTLFEAPTLAGLASAIEQSQHTKTASVQPPTLKPLARIAHTTKKNLEA